MLQAKTPKASPPRAARSATADSGSPLNHENSPATTAPRAEPVPTNPTSTGLGKNVNLAAANAKSPPTIRTDRLSGSHVALQRLARPRTRSMAPRFGTGISIGSAGFPVRLSLPLGWDFWRLGFASSLKRSKTTASITRYRLPSPRYCGRRII